MRFLVWAHLLRGEFIGNGAMAMRYAEPISVCKKAWLPGPRQMHARFRASREAASPMGRSRSWASVCAFARVAASRITSRVIIALLDWAARLWELGWPLVRRPDTGAARATWAHQSPHEILVQTHMLSETRPWCGLVQVNALLAELLCVGLPYRT